MAPGAARGKSVALLALAVSLACVALLVLFGRPTGRLPAPAARPPDAKAPPVAAAVPAAERPANEAAVPEPAYAPEPEDAPAAGPAPREAAAEPEPEPEDAPKAPSGIGLFPPPGTDPVKIGIVVPDDYELPEGYLRHYQATDDGQELEPILLFHPDYELLDDAGRPLPLPESRVVPPELAPPGLPIRMLELPPPREETGP